MSRIRGTNRRAIAAMQRTHGRLRAIRAMIARTASESFEMSFYRERVLPHIIHAAMKKTALAPFRQRIAANADGRVLEIGIGSGLNLPLYARATHVIGLDPSPRLLSMARAAARGLAQSVELLEGTAEAIPLPDRSVDTVVATWTFCSIGDVARALGEIRRVLTPGGRLLFAEHGRSPEPRVARWQARLTPLWKRIGGGCHLDRPIAEMIAAGGFRIDSLQTGYIGGPKPMTFMYEGVAHCDSEKSGSRTAVHSPPAMERLGGLE